MKNCHIITLAKITDITKQAKKALEKYSKIKNGKAYIELFQITTILKA